jgi:hypothetical protein
MFLVYNRPNVGNIFKNFMDILYLINMLDHLDYSSVVNMPFPRGAELSKGQNTFHVMV